MLFNDYPTYGYFNVRLCCDAAGADRLAFEGK